MRDYLQTRDTVTFAFLFNDAFICYKSTFTCYKTNMRGTNEQNKDPWLKIHYITLEITLEIILVTYRNTLKIQLRVHTSTCNLIKQNALK